MSHLTRALPYRAYAFGAAMIFCVYLPLPAAAQDLNHAVLFDIDIEVVNPKWWESRVSETAAFTR